MAPTESDRLLDAAALDAAAPSTAPLEKAPADAAPAGAPAAAAPEPEQNIWQFPLVGLCLVSFLLGFTWATFNMLPDASMKLLPLSIDDLALLINCNNLFAIPATPLSIWLLASPPANADGSASTGLRLTVIISVISLLAQTGLWSLAARFPTHAWSVPALMIGSCAGGVGATFAQGCVTRLSAVWYPQRLRGQTTSIAFAAYFAGDAASYVASLCICVPNELAALLFLQFALCVVIALPIAVIFPDAPAPSKAASGGKEEEEGDPQIGLLDGVRSLLCGPDLLLVAITVSIGGFYSAWQSMIPVMWDEADDEIGKSCPSSMPIMLRIFSVSKQGDILGLSSGVSYAIGGAFAGSVADRFFSNRLKALLTITLALLALSFIPIVLDMLPPPWVEDSTVYIDTTRLKGHRHWSGHRLRPVPAAPEGPRFYGYFFFITLTGIFAGAAMPPAMELLAESAFPVPEGTSANVVMLFYQCTAIANTFLAGTWLSPEASNVVILLLSAVGAALMPWTRERYARQAARGSKSEV